MCTNSVTGRVDLILGERVVAAVNEAVQDDPKAYGLADGEEADALRALSASLSAVDESGCRIAMLIYAERSVRESLRSSAVLPGAGRVPTA